MYWVLVLCIGYLSYVLGISLMYWILVLCIGYLSDVWDISLMSRILVLCGTTGCGSVNEFSNLGPF